MNPDEPLLDLAVAVADGTPVDWHSAESSLPSAADRQLLRELRFIADLARVDSDPSPAPASVPGVPLQWGVLRIIERVGGGAFGEVFRAWDTRLDREVALKLMHREPADRAATSSTVVHEGRLLARVRHPNVVSVYGAECIDARVGIWMEFIHGHTLEEELAREGPLAVENVIVVGVAMASALAAVHRAGLVHRDVKAQNVMRAGDGRLVLADFGAGCELVKSVHGRRELAGTPLYLAPEVFDGQTATAASDIYSLGVLLFHLVTAAYPVQGKTFEEVRDAHAHGDRTRLGVARPALSPRFVDVVERALDRDPAKRFQSAEDLGAALSAASARPTRRWLITGPAVGLLLATTALVLMLGYHRGAPHPAAYALYQEARALAELHRGMPAVRRAATLFEEAIAKDPDFAPAYAGLAHAWTLLSINYGGVPPDEALAVLRPAAEKALALDPRLPDAHSAMGVAFARDWKWDQSEAAFRAALALDRQLASTYVTYALACLFPQGKLEDAIAALSTAERLDPLPRDVQRQLAWVQINARQYDAAIRNARRVLAAEPDDLHVRQVLARALLLTGDAVTAVPIFEQLGAPSRGFLGYAYAVTGKREEAEAIAARDRAFPARQALVLAGLGRKSEALDALERMVANGEPRAGIYLTHPELATLRTEPRFEELRRRLGLH